MGRSPVDVKKECPGLLSKYKTAPADAKLRTKWALCQWHKAGSIGAQLKPTTAQAKHDAQTRKRLEKPVFCSDADARLQGYKVVGYKDWAKKPHVMHQPCKNKVTRADMMHWTAWQQIDWNKKAVAAAKTHTTCDAYGREKGYHEVPVNTVGRVIKDNSTFKNGNIRDRYRTIAVACSNATAAQKAKGKLYVAKNPPPTDSEIDMYYRENPTIYNKVDPKTLERKPLPKGILSHVSLPGPSSHWATPAEREQNAWMTNVVLNEVKPGDPSKKVTFGGTKEQLAALNKHIMEIGLSGAREYEAHARNMKMLMWGGAAFVVLGGIVYLAS